MIYRFFDIYSKPGLRPDKPDSPRNPARQEIFSQKRGEGGLSECTPQHKSG
jgi:hypothetical protein